MFFVPFLGGYLDPFLDHLFNLLGMHLRLIADPFLDQIRVLTNPGVGVIGVDSFGKIGRIPWGRILFSKESTPLQFYLHTNAHTCNPNCPGSRHIR